MKKNGGVPVGGQKNKTLNSKRNEVWFNLKVDFFSIFYFFLLYFDKKKDINFFEMRRNNFIFVNS